MLRIVISYESNTTSAHTGLGMWPRLIECGRARLPFRVKLAERVERIRLGLYAAHEHSRLHVSTAAEH